MELCWISFPLGVISGFILCYPLKKSRGLNLDWTIYLFSRNGNDGFMGSHNKGAKTTLHMNKSATLRLLCPCFNFLSMIETNCSLSGLKGSHGWVLILGSMLVDQIYGLDLSQT